MVGHTSINRINESISTILGQQPSLDRADRIVCRWENNTTGLKPFIRNAHGGFLPGKSPIRRV
jgi:hypothetical protein